MSGGKRLAGSKTAKKPDLSQFSKWMIAISPDQMSVWISIYEMHMNNLITKCIKPLVYGLTGNSHCSCIDHYFQIRMIHFIVHPFCICKSYNKLGLLWS